MVGLDVGGAGAAAGLDDVGVERALDEVGRVLPLGDVGEDAHLGGLEDADELAADDLALLLGVHDPLERAEELVARVDHVEGVEDRLEVGAHLLGLAEPHHPVVDVDTGEPVADRALHDRGRDRGVDAAGQRADRPPVADLGADRLDLLLDDVEHRPGLPAAGDVVQEVLEHLLAVLGVQHLRVPLHAGQPAADVLERRHRRAGRRGQHREPLGRGRDRVAVRHPDVVLDRYVGQQRAGRADRDRRAAVLAGAGVGDLAAEPLRHQLEAVAHAEHRRPGREQRRVDARRALGVDRRGAAGQHDRLGLARQHLGHRHRVRHDLGVDPRLAHPPRDQLRVLGPEVDDEDQVVVRREHHAAVMERA